MTRFARFCAALVILSCFLPVALAAPTVLPSASAAVFVANSDYIEFASAHVNQAGTTITVMDPDGTRFTITRTGVDQTENGAPYPSVRFYLTGATAATGGTGQAAPTEWTRNGNILLGAPADGTWTITTRGAQYNSYGDTGSNSDQRPIKLFVAGKAIRFGVSGVQQGVNHDQIWNWRITAAAGTFTDYLADGGGGQAAVQTDPVIEADEDPFNAVFFQGTGSPFTAHTLQYVVSCTAVPTMTITGAWQGAGGTVFSQHIYRDGFYTTATTPDLRVPFASVTTEENEGALTNGIDSKSVPYNNAAGTSYQFKARTVAQGEVLGFVVYAPPLVCSPAAPGGSILFIRAIGLDLSVSQAQCANDPISFSTDVDITALITLGDLQVTVFRASDGVEVATFDDAQMLTQNALQTYYFETFLAPGAYMAIAQADLVGIGAVDIYDSAAVNVPAGSCVDSIPDLSPVLEAIAGLNLTVAPTFNVTVNPGNFTFTGNATFNGNLTGSVDLQFPGSIDEPGLYWWLELVFWLAVFYFCWYFNAWATLAFAIGGCLHLVNPSWFFGLGQSIPWVGLTAFVELWVHRHRSPSLVSGGQG